MSISHHVVWAEGQRKIQRRAERHLDDFPTSVDRCADCPYRVCIGRPCGQVDS